MKPGPFSERVAVFAPMGIDTQGFWVGDIRSNFQGVLRGTPKLVDFKDQQKS